MKNTLEARHIVKRYGDFRALNDVNIAVPKGSVYGLLGPNGAGKTSLIRIINQITMPDGGDILLNGEPLEPKHISQIGYMPEERGLYKSMKVGEQCIYLAMLKGLSKSEAKAKLEYWFDRLGMQGWWNKKLQELSKGMAQKVQFIVTVMHEPDLLIFDEPFSGFDPVNANLIKDEILQLRDQGATIIFSTHRMESVEEMCDHIALINKSNVVLSGKLSEVKQQFRNREYAVSLITQDNARTLQSIPDLYNAEGIELSGLDNTLDFKIRLPEDITIAQSLNDLTSLGELTHFSEIIPSVNDIFIKTVKQDG
ncbi:MULTISPECIES: ABC transporter ATP-binding protein [Nonlabens]|uniref:ABC transporter ATP-binding protein n=4 Tax=Nonlabens ulvanivorans TaxID=906888 RepID=A0A084JVT1_NONUL|nr:ATP-binding cassette domain-containing protein [Nonlabens ulvanivorans]KEZ93065.1 ABC transporter ATP-binding protein [Nonlabens ulvanivorans]PRX12705.1 ABC-2 type transport system ATP-binding protein [Nonlabens ulvanivorans]WOI24072.1 ATP-binding cassette domain-containing protein [Nonlabens ulvanivorans]